MTRNVWDINIPWSSSLLKNKHLKIFPKNAMWTLMLLPNFSFKKCKFDWQRWCEVGYLDWNVCHLVVSQYLEYLRICNSKVTLEHHQQKRTCNHPTIFQEACGDFSTIRSAPAMFWRNGTLFRLFLLQSSGIFDKLKRQQESNITDSRAFVQGKAKVRRQQLTTSQKKTLSGPFSLVENRYMEWSAHVVK